jgi:hypothetical protein
VGLPLAGHVDLLGAVLGLIPCDGAELPGDQAFQDAPPWWVGGLVLAGYGVALAAFGAASIRRSDVA